MFLSYGSNVGVGAVAKHMNEGVGSKIAMGAERYVLEASIGLEGVVPQGE